MAIRPAVEGDIEAIREIARETWVQAYSEVMERNDLQRRVLEEGFYSDSYILDSIECEKAVFLVHESHGEITGFCHTEYLDVSPSGEVRSHDVAELRKLYVSPDHWREGKGSELLQKSVEVLPGFIENVRIHVLKDNSRAKKFYRVHDFEKTGEEKIRIWGENYTAERMEKSL